MDRQFSPRSPLAQGIEWASRLTTLGLGFALPPLLGHWIDGRFGSKPWGVLIGSFLGLAAGTAGLMQIIRSRSGPPTPPESSP